jgi:hypothetical protein
MSIQVFGSEFRPNQPHNPCWQWFSLDVGDVFTDPLNGATVTITGVAVGVAGAATSIAYTINGSFTASPATLATFQGWLMNHTLVRGSYRGGIAPSPQWPASEFDKAGISSGEQHPTN